ncbi:hypothetical protein BGZ58_010832 [Dissophora ornata]|nr:hypothetical protein BGZ58_010832 [Dissophora ornata]
MQEEVLKTLAAKCAKVVAADSIKSFLNWLPRRDEYLEDLTRILMEVNETITARRNKKLKSVVQKNARVERAESSGSGLSFVQYTPAPELAKSPSPQPFSDLAWDSSCATPLLSTPPCNTPSPFEPARSSTLQPFPDLTSTTPRLSTRLHSTHSPFGLSSMQYSQAHELPQLPSPPPFPDLASAISPPSTPRSKMFVSTTPSRNPRAPRKISFNPWNNWTASTYNQGTPSKRRRVVLDKGSKSRDINIQEDDDCLSFIKHGSLDRNPFLVPEAPEAPNVATTVTNNQDGDSLSVPRPEHITNTSNENKEENDNSAM